MKSLSLFLTLFFLFYINSEAQKQTELSYAELERLMLVEYKKGDYRKAIPYMEMGREKAKAEFGEQDSTYAVYTVNLGIFYYQLGEYAQAEKLYMEGENIRANIFGKEHPQYGDCLNNLAVLYQNIGKYAQAEPLLLEAKDINAKVFGKEHSGYATSLNNLGLLYKFMGSFAQAEPLYLEAKNIWGKNPGKETPQFTKGLNNLAALYIAMGNFDQAESFLIEASQIDAKVLGKEHPYYSKSLQSLATLYLTTGDYIQAEPLFLEAKAILAKALGKMHPQYATIVGNLGSLYQKMGSYAEAETALLESTAIDAIILGKEHPSYSRSLNNLSTLYLDMEKLNLALKYCLASLDANSAQIDSNFFQSGTASLNLSGLEKFEYYSNENMNKSIQTLLIIIKAQYKKSGDQEKLEQHYKVAQFGMKLNESIRNNLSNEGDKLRILRNNSLFVLKGIETALLLDNDTYKKAAFSFAEQNKSILLADAVKGNRARILGDLPDSLISKELLFQKKMTALKRHQVNAKTEEQKNKINKSLGDLNLKIDAFLKSLQDKYPKYHALKYENITSNVADIQTLLDEKTLIIEYFQAERALYLFVLSKNTMELFSLDIRKEVLGEKIKKLRYALSNYTFITKKPNKAIQMYTQSAHWFYKEILEIGLQDKKGIQDLVIIADGELGHLPFEAFLMDDVLQSEKDYSKLPYLIKDYNISYNYSATLWKENLTSKKLLNNNQMLACAASYPPVDSTLLELRLPYFYKLRTTLQPLPAAQYEIASLSKKFQGDFLYEQEVEESNNSSHISYATNEKFFKENAHKYGIIHLAMHGIFDPRVPMLSSLAFTEDRDSTEDNFLQAYEISHLHLNADLVVLSACETGYGKFEQGEGIVSLARSFMYAGVPSLIVSLWQVNDNSTSTIMTSFYQNLADGMPKDKALRQAKLTYIQTSTGIIAHPAFWSPFIQLGDSRPIVLATKNGWFWYIVGGFFMVILMIGFRYKKE